MSTACVQRENQQDARLVPYIQSFEDTFGIAYTASAFFYSIHDGKAGWFRRDECGSHIEFNVNTWATYTENQKTFLVFHEIGHSLDLKHDDTILSDGCNGSIMNYRLQSNNGCIEKHWQYYIDDLASRL